MADIIFPGEDPLGVLGATRLPDNVDMEFWRGDTQVFNIVLQNEDGTPIDLTGATAMAVIRQDFTNPTTYEFDCSIHDGNQVTITLSAETSATIPGGNYIWNFQITFSDGSVRTFLAGDVTVDEDVD